jgi:hypothetical protein
VVLLDASHFQAAGAPLAKTETADIVDAYVVVCVRRSGPGVIASDPPAACASPAE